MKIKFHNADAPQRSVKPEQDEMRRTAVKKHPVVRFVLLLALLAVGVYALYRFYPSGRIYTYGIVTGKTTRLHAQADAEVMSVAVSQGKTVQKGTVLAVLKGRGLESEIVRAEEELKRINFKLEDALKKNGTVGSADASRVAAVTAAERAREGTRHEIELIRSRNRREQLRRKTIIKKARLELEKLQSVFQNKKERLAKVKKLHELDAAVLDSVSSAANEAAVAEKNMKQAELDLKHAIEEDALAEKNDKAELTSVKKKHTLAERKYTEIVESFRKSANSSSEIRKVNADILRSEARAAKSRLDDLRKRAGTYEITALYDGVVTDVSIHSGMTVQKGDRLFECCSHSAIHVDTYLAARFAETVEQGASARMYTEEGAHITDAVVESRGNVIVSIPEPLRKHFPEMNEGVFLRITPGKKTGLIPGRIIRVTLGRTD